MENKKRKFSIMVWPQKTRTLQKPMIGRVEKRQERSKRRDFGKENRILGCLVKWKMGRKKVANLWDL